MPDRKQPTRRSVDLGHLIFSAKIDYVSIHTQGKQTLPELDGRAVWPRKLHGSRLTVHDASPADIATLIGIFGPARLFELEVAVDVRPRVNFPAQECDQLLRSVMVDVFARGLDPSAGQGMSKGFRAFYRRLDQGYMVRPFNRGLPRSTDQQLHGGRNDAAQVKGYLKTRDNGVVLAPNKQVARVEVRLGSEGLLGHDLTTITNLSGFDFRKKLMPYFRHVQGTVRPRRSPSQSRGLLPVLDAKNHDYDQEQFQHVGMGAFLPGGKREGQRVRLIRDTPVNNRIGQALLRLGRQLRENKFVCGDEPNIGKSPMPVRVSGLLGQSSMTNQ